MKKKYTRRQLKKIIAIQQDQSDCGVAALQTVIHWHGGIAFSEDLRIVTGANANGTTMLGLYQAAFGFGLDTDGYEMEMEDLLKQEQPCIIHLLMDEHRLHYMVYLGFLPRKNKILIGDPAQGLKLLSPDELSKIWVSKSALLLKPNDHFSKVKQSLAKDKAKWFVRYIRADVPLLGISILLGLFISTMGLSTAVFSQKLIDKFLPVRDGKHIVIGLVLLSVILIGRTMLSYLRQQVMLKQGWNYNERLTGYFIEKILRFPKAFYDGRKSGDLIARLNDAQRIQQNISHIVGNVAIDILICLISLSVIFFYSPLIGFVVFSFIPFAIYLLYNHAFKFVQGQKEVMNSHALMENFYINTLQGIAAIKETHAHRFFANKGKSIFSTHQEAVYKIGQYSNRLTTKIDMLASFVTVTAMTAAIHEFYRDQLSIGALIATTSLMSSILPSVVRLAQINLHVQEIKVAFDRVYDLTNTKEDTVDDDGTETEHLNFERLSLENIGFRFKGHRNLFDNVDFHIQKGELVGVVGPSGSGKSTFMEIVQGFYVPDEGQISINGERHNSLRSRFWKNTFATVPQDIKLFNGSVYSNVVMGRSCSLEEFHTFCQSYGFDHFSSKWPMGILTPLGDDGIKLSGGQKQIVAFARALFKNPQLLLLDEATSALDPHTESFILHLIQKLKVEQGKAVLFATHRNVIRHIADRIYRFKDGTLYRLPSIQNERTVTGYSPQKSANLSLWTNQT